MKENGKNTVFSKMDKDSKMKERKDTGEKTAKETDGTAGGQQIRSGQKKKQIYLHTEKELRAYMHPLRQKILHCLSMEPTGMTAKQLADRLGVAPSSAGHHLSALVSIGLAELSHTEKIHGLTAKYYRALPADVCLKETEPAAANMREALVRNSAEELQKHFFEKVADKEKKGEDIAPGQADAMFGVIYLRPEEAEELHRRIMEFLAEHSIPESGTVPCEYGLIFYQVQAK